MEETTKRPFEQLHRFGRATRNVHLATTIIMFVEIITAAALYVGFISVMVGNRSFFENIHIYVGLALPVPLLIGWFYKEVRKEAHTLNRFSTDDKLWLRAKHRASGALRVGKYNAGQKLNSAFTVGAIIVMVVTGVVMRFGGALPVSYRTGATFVHDWLSYAIVIVIIGHMMKAFGDPMAREGMRTGKVSRDWAEREHPQWAEETTTS